MKEETTEEAIALDELQKSEVLWLISRALVSCVITDLISGRFRHKMEERTIDPVRIANFFNELELVDENPSDLELVCTLSYRSHTVLSPILLHNPKGVESSPAIAPYLSLLVSALFRSVRIERLYAFVIVVIDSFFFL